MRNKAFLLLLALVLLTVFAVACADSDTNIEEPDRIKTPKVDFSSTQLLEVEDVEFQLTESLEDYMEANNLSDLALVTVICRT